MVIVSEIEFITWSHNSHLKWTDFKAEPNPGVFEDSHSVIKYGFTWLVNSDKLNDEIVYFVDNIKISVNFNPLLSWVRNSEATPNLLEHEQGHFNLAELIKRKHNKVFTNKFHDKFFSTRGQNDAQRKQFAKEDSAKMISNEIDELNDILSNKRNEYDIETDFGKNLEIQSKYDQLFKTL